MLRKQQNQGQEETSAVHFHANCLGVCIPVKLPGSSPCKRQDIKPRSSHALGSGAQFRSVSKLHIVGLLWAEHAALLALDKAPYPCWLHHIYPYETVPGRLFHLWKTLFSKPALCWAHLSFHTPSQGSYLSAVIYSLMQHFPILWDNNHEAFKFQLSRAGVQRGCGLHSEDNGNLRQGTPVQGPPGRKATSFSFTFPSP